MLNFIKISIKKYTLVELKGDFNQIGQHYLHVMQCLRF